jgi:hypothetical protein
MTQAFAQLAAPLPTHAEPGARAANAAARPAAIKRSNTVTPSAVAAHYDLLVYGSTPGGIACAVRAAREGLSVLLVTHSSYLGGMFSSGLSVMDTLYAGPRSALYDELRRAIHDHYRITYGPDSPQFAASRPGHPKAYYEAHVVEQIVEEMVGREPGIAVVRGFYPVGAPREAALIREVAFKERHGTQTFAARADVYADCSYEGDLAVTAGAPYRKGREARTEFNEEHAGRIFLRRVTPFPPPEIDPAVIAEYKKLNLFHYDRWFEIMRDVSTGEADDAVQTYNIRAVLTTNPSNRYIPPEPPPGYDRAMFEDIWSKKPPYSQLLGPLPNQKYLWNMPELVGAQNAYPEGDWKLREEITEQHRRATAGMLYYLQNDSAVTAEERAQWRNLGFARDEFADSNHLPQEVYARQTRRVKGRATFTENDARLASGLKRTPVYSDSIAVTEWFLDVHAVGRERVRDSLYEGELYLNYISHPGQVSYRTILAAGLDNLLVPVCLSATHIGWGAIRLEPTWMNIGESAGYAAALAVQQRVSPVRIDSDVLVRRLAQRRVMVSFFNDVALDSAEPWVSAIEYLGTQGFFGSYDADPFGPLTSEIAQAWAKCAAEWIKGEQVNVTERARGVLTAERAGGDAVSGEHFARTLVQALRAAALPVSATQVTSLIGRGSERSISRGNACRVMFELGSKPQTTQ